MNLLGQKDFFAVEYKITNYEYFLGYSKVWFGGESFGTKEDEIYIDSYLIRGLKEIYNSREIDIELPVDTNQSYHLMEKRLRDINDNTIHFYLNNFGTFCDDFTILSYLLGDEINILWKLNSIKTLFADLNMQKQTVNHFKIKKELYKELLNDFEVTIKNDFENHINKLL